VSLYVVLSWVSGEELYVLFDLFKFCIADDLNNVKQETKGY